MIKFPQIFPSITIEVKNPKIKGGINIYAKHLGGNTKNNNISSSSADNPMGPTMLLLQSIFVQAVGDSAENHQLPLR